MLLKTCFSLALTFCLFASQLAIGQTNALLLSGKISHLPGVTSFSEEPRAAACTPATALRDLEWNNIDALIETGGSMWQDRANGRSHYYAPKADGLSVLFAGALWLGGVSPDQQLKLAAIQYRYGGSDFWPGPLSNDGSGETTPDVCITWDRFNVTYRTDAALHRQYHDCLNDPDCDMQMLFPNGYTTPSYFAEYPAHGIVAQGQDFYLSPYYDYDGSGDYTPDGGDYPWYDLTREIDCEKRLREDAVPLFGDQTYFWIFNDKGNIHSESGGQAIGMEIRAQAFAFSTNDEINNMTFYNYVLINQGSQTLQNTYFGTWIDCDIGGHVDDFVGCDVQRGLGYGYNGNAFDAPSALSFGYGENPPAVGVDFFEGPYQDEDGVDNPLTLDIFQAFEEKGIPYKGIGIGYGDSIIDNERFGMRKFLYHVSGNADNGPPIQPIHYYNYLRGYWKNGQRMSYGGNALSESSGTDINIPADFMFPGDTDPLHFGTNGITTEPWTEVSSGNPPSDRRFMQSAGPFTLLPGDYNNITVGVVYARSLAGDPFESVELVRQADDKAQALFDNCFELISGPDAPDVVVRELENELILMWTNENPMSSNLEEGYMLKDPTIPETDINGNPYTDEERSYVFQGYMIYQLKDESVSASELENITRARLIGQCDIEDDVLEIINYARDPETQLLTASLKVQGRNEGIFHSMRITEDAFALGTTRLINHKTYYFMVIAYGYNNYREFDPATGIGQDEKFLPSRKSALAEIRIAKGIPHKITPQAGGTISHAQYGQEISLTQVEGMGNGERVIRMSNESEKSILNENAIQSVQYLEGNSPVRVKVIDPLRVPIGQFDLQLAPNNQDLMSDSSFWKLTNISTGEIYESQHSIRSANEELMLSWGISVEWSQIYFDDVKTEHFTKFLEGNIQFEDNTNPWLGGFPDDDSPSAFNWIRSGYTFVDLANTDPLDLAYNDYTDGAPIVEEFIPAHFTDPGQEYENVLGGTWSPYCLVSATTFNAELNMWLDPIAPTIRTLKGDLTNIALPDYTSNIKGLNNIDVVFTADKSLWTRCPVFEMQNDTNLAEGGAPKMQMRRHASIDKNGKSSGDAGCNVDEATHNGEQPIGMSWFPGYVIDVGTGERLNMAFGEDSWQTSENGSDLIWNPGSNILNSAGQIVCGGQHWIYVFKNMQYINNASEYMPEYDEGTYVYSLRDANGNLNATRLRRLFSACTWVGSAIRNDAVPFKTMEDGLIPNKTRIELRVAKAFQKFDVLMVDDTEYDLASNWWNPRYEFSTTDQATETASMVALTSSLDYLNIVPNPYYAFSNYEMNKLDNRVKITNLPEECQISIYTINGTLIRQFKKADPTTFLDWDLKNDKNIPIASGVYLIHISVPGAGERVLKWFGVMRPVDLDSF
jgi:hypothetical protein